MIRKNNKRVLYESIMKDVAKTVKRHLNENINNIDTFKRLLKRYNVVLQGPDSAGIAYITPTMNDSDPDICIEVYDDYWRCYLDDDNNGTIWVSLDEEGTADEELDLSQFDNAQTFEYGVGYSYSARNAKALAQGLLKFC